MNRVFLDANVLIDFLDKDRVFSNESLKVLELLIDNNYEIFTSCDILTTLYYISSKKFKNRDLIENIKDLLKIIEIIPITKELSLQTLNFIEDKNLDFEDTLQYFSALQYACNFIITNDRNFIKKEIKVLSTLEFVRIYS